MEVILLVLAAVILGIYIRRYYLSEKGVSIARSLFPSMRLRRKQKHVDSSPAKPREETGEGDKNPKQKSVAKMPRRSAAILLFREAMEVYNKGDLDEAAKMFINVTAVDEHFDEARHRLGLIYLVQGQFGKAEVIYNELIKNSDTDAVYHSNLGRALYEQSKFEEALQVYLKALELDDSRAARYISTAEVYRQLDNKEKAQEMYKKALEIEPSNIDYLLTFAHFLQDDNKNEQAREYVKKVLDLEPENTIAVEMLKELAD